MADASSRYAKTGTYVGTDTLGRQREGFELRAIPKVAAAFYYTPNQSERIDNVAYKFYKDPRKFWKICDVSDNLDPFDVVVAGSPVLIPPDK